MVSFDPINPGGFFGDSSGGSSDDDGGGSSDDGDDGGGFTLTKGAVLGVLGIGAATWDTIVDFAQDPTGFILGILLPWLVGGILDGWAVVLGALGSVWNPITMIPSSISDPISEGGGAILNAALGVIELLNGAIVGLASSAGPFAPLVVAAIWILIGALLGAALNATPAGRVIKLGLEAVS